MSTMTSGTLEQSPDRRRFFALRARAQRLMIWERRVSAWNMLWVPIVMAMILGGWCGVIEWRLASHVAAGQTLFVLLLMVVNARRHRVVATMQALEERIGQAG